MLGGELEGGIPPLDKRGGELEGGDVPLPGHRIADRYELIDSLGEGRIARVFRAFDHQATGSPLVAIKLPLPQHARRPEFLARFQREFAAGRRFIHSTLARSLDIGEFSGLPYLVTDFVEGRPIDVWFGKTGRSFEKLAEVLIRILEGLAAAHAHRLVHRELKPNNVLVCPTPLGEEPRLLDFGLAGRLEDQLRGGDETSSLAYISPEQALGERGDERSDLYSLGAILYSLVAGRPMFSQQNASGLLLSQINDEPTPLGRLRADVPVWLERLVTRLLQKNPDRRPGSAQEVLALVRRRSQTVPVASARQETWWPRGDELALLGASLQALKSGGAGSSLRVTGPLGCGLSSFLQQAREEASASGLHVLQIPSDSELTMLSFLRHPALSGNFLTTDDVVQAFAALGPTVVLVDNAHRADAQVSQVLAGLASLRNLVLVAAAQESKSPLHAPFGREIALKGWSRDVCAAYIEDRLWATPPPEMVQWIWKSSQGLPVFLKLLLERLEGRNFRVETGDILWNAPAPGEIPESLDALLVEMLAQQGPELSDVLGVAACLGETFELNLLRAVGLKDDVQLEHLLEVATRAGWLEELWDGGVAAYRFSHPARRQAALSKYPERRQRRFHLLVGAFWERAQRQVSDWERACRHYELAHEWELALRSLLQVLRSCADDENWAEGRYWMRRCRSWAQHLPPELRADQVFPAPWGNFGWSGKSESTGCLHFLAASLYLVGDLDAARWYLQAAFEEGLEGDRHRWLENRLLMAMAVEPTPEGVTERGRLLDEALEVARGHGLDEHAALASGLRVVLRTASARANPRPLDRV